MLVTASNSMYNKLDNITGYKNRDYKLYKTEPSLLWKANRKPYPRFQLAPVSVILSDHILRSK